MGIDIQTKQSKLIDLLCNGDCNLVTVVRWTKAATIGERKVKYYSALCVRHVQL